MNRLLANSEAESQALANARRGVLCQALLPSIDGDRNNVATECLSSNPEVVRMVEPARFADVRTLMDGGTGKFRPWCESIG